MRAAIVDSNGIIQNTVFVNTLADLEGAVPCPEWLSIGMDINAPTPQFITPASVNKATALKKLQETDWVSYPDVHDASLPLHLKNRADFLQYRYVVRLLFVSPVAGNVEWPVEPKANWSTAP